jgi:hypothetical protein
LTPGVSRGRYDRKYSHVSAHADVERSLHVDGPLTGKGRMRALLADLGDMGIGLLTSTYQS